MSESTSLKGRPTVRLFRMLNPDSREIRNIYLFAIFSGLINLSLPLGIQAILNLTLANQLSSSWVLLIVVVTVGTALAGVIQIMQLSLTEVLQQRIFSRAALEFAFRIPRFKLEALLKYYPPELINRFFDILNVQKGLPKILIDFSTAILQIFFGLVVLSFYHPFFVFFGLALVFLLGVIIRVTGPRGLTTSLEESEYKYSVVYWLEEIARTLGTFKLAGDTDLALNRTDQLVTGYLEARKEHFKVLILQFGNIVGFKTIVTAGLLILGSLLLIQREINIGQFVASEIIIILIINSVEKLVMSADTVYDVLTAMEKIGKVTDLPLEQHKGLDYATVDTNKGMSVTIRNLEYTWPGDEKPSLTNISLDVEPGEKVCISGFSGSGKTLLLNIISGLYENCDGILAYNGIPYRNYDNITLRRYVGDCLSQKMLFRGTLLENLTMGNSTISLDDVMWALDKLDLTEYVQALPDGLNTMLVPEGPQLPESITRKLILAKCIAKRPKLLVMDNFLTILDREQRDRIAGFLTNNPDWSLIGVSNDPTFAARCDKVVVMNQGTIMAVGSYRELTRQPWFDNLFNT